MLLHGGGDTITTSFGEILPSLADTRQVVAFAQQGFGHTFSRAGADAPFWDGFAGARLDRDIPPGNV